ncbi:MAG: hypothetical protein WC312_03715 [Candidatus Omnitrophota bacterium]|jgi:hypothetical protein
MLEKNDIQRELEYLRQLKIRYGSHYVRKYFGFSFKEIGEKIGLNKIQMSNVITGKRKLQGIQIDRLKNAFLDMNIEAKTKDFKETPAQLARKGLWRAGVR